MTYGFDFGPIFSTNETHHVQTHTYRLPKMLGASSGDCIVVLIARWLAAYLTTHISTHICRFGRLGTQLECYFVGKEQLLPCF